MPKRKPETPITSATHRLSLEIAKPHVAVWKAFTGDIHSWWPKDFYVTTSPQRIVFEVKPGGRLYEDSGNFRLPGGAQRHSRGLAFAFRRRL